MSPTVRGEHTTEAPRTSAAAELTIFVVATPYGAEQAFSCRADADRYAEGRPGTTVSEHSLRRSVDEAVVIIDRRVVVRNGELHAT